MAHPKHHHRAPDVERHGLLLLLLLLLLKMMTSLCRDLLSLLPARYYVRAYHRYRDAVLRLLSIIRQRAGADLLHHLRRGMSAVY